MKTSVRKHTRTLKSGRVTQVKKHNRSFEGPKKSFPTSSQSKRLQSLRQNISQGDLDPAASRELELYGDNDAQLYTNMKLPILKLLEKRVMDGTYNRELAILAFKNYSDAAAKKYNSEFGPTNFSTNSRFQVAKREVQQFEENLKAGETYR